MTKPVDVVAELDPAFDLDVWLQRARAKDPVLALATPVTVEESWRNLTEATKAVLALKAGRLGRLDPVASVLADRVLDSVREIVRDAQRPWWRRIFSAR